MSYIRILSKGPVAPFVSECMRQSQLKPQIKEDFEKNGNMSDDPSWKCFLKCLAIKLEVFDSTGEVNVQRWADLFNHLDLPLAEKCSHFQEMDLCEKAYLMYKCVYDEYSKRYPS